MGKRNTVDSLKQTPCPDVFRYHDHLEFLKGWFAYQKANQPGFSFRSLARQTKLAVGYLPMVFSGKRQLSPKALAKLVPALGLSQNERHYFESLVALGTSDSQQARLDALERMRQFRSYRKENPQELEVYQYLKHWYYVAIREMAAFKDFRLEAEWIRSRLRSRVPLAEIREAVEFLVKHGYIVPRADGTVHFPEKDIECVGGVFRLAIVQFHREMFSLATRALEEVPSDERNITGHMLPLAAEDFEEVKRILDDALSKVAAIGKRGKPADTVYHVIFAGFPVTTKKARDEK